MDRFIRVNGQEFSFEDVAKALGVECDPQREPVQVHLCQRVNDGVLVAKGAFFDKDDYPAIDLDLELPAEKDSMPVPIFKVEQPRVEGPYSDGFDGVRSFVYNRDGEYFMYTDVDSRADAVVDRDGMEQRVMVSGSPTCDVEVYQENPYVWMRGQQEFVYKENFPDVKFEVGMTGIIKDTPDVKKELRGKAFEIVKCNDNEPWSASCKVEGKKGTFSIYRSDMEDLRMPEVSLEVNLRGYQSADVVYPEFPHDFGNGYKVQTFYANVLPADHVSDVGDIYDVREDAEAEHPDDEIVVGFCVVYENDGLFAFPDGCNDFNRTVEDAIRDYEEHVLPDLQADKTSFEGLLQNAKERSESGNIEEDGREDAEIGLD